LPRRPTAGFTCACRLLDALYADVGRRYRIQNRTVPCPNSSNCMVLARHDNTPLVDRF
jgi:hypothetical protein